MEVAMEDDLFFADLNRQISLLIMDDEEDPALHCPNVSLQAFPQAIQHQNSPAFFNPDDFRREIKGTGVFIPRSSQPRRKNRQGGRQSSSNTSKSNNRQIVSSRSVSQVSYGTSNNRF
ncbi:hypothetical protein V2J09_014156 [Rumex salicifolius]